MSNILVTRSSMPSFEEYCEEIKDLWDSHWLTNMGVKHKELQKELEDYFGLWKFVISQTTEVLNVYELLPAFITGLVVNIVVSLCTPKPEKEIIDEFEKVNAMK